MNNRTVPKNNIRKIHLKIKYKKFNHPLPDNILIMFMHAKTDISPFKIGEKIN